MDWTDYRLLAATAGGVIIALLLSTANTLKARVASVASGIFFAVFFTEGVIEWAGLAFSTWQYGVAGLLAMTGDRIARRIMSLADSLEWPRAGGSR